MLGIEKQFYPSDRDTLYLDFDHAESYFTLQNNQACCACCENKGKQVTTLVNTKIVKSKLQIIITPSAVENFHCTIINQSKCFNLSLVPSSITLPS